MTNGSAIKHVGTAKFGNWLGAVGQSDTDSDGDGFADELEKEKGSDPRDPQSTPSISYEKFVRTADQDGDGLSDADEAVLRTNARIADTDGDGCSDGAEYLSGTNPLVKDSIVNDIDGDCLSDDVEKQLGTNINSRDTDADKLSDALGSRHWYRPDPTRYRWRWDPGLERGSTRIESSRER